MKTPLAFIGAIALPLYALDQWTKALVIEGIPPYSEPRPIIDGFFYLCHWQNTGAAFSMGSGKNGFFIALSVVTLAGLLFFSARGAFRDLLSRIAVALLVAGILGNVTDRLRFSHVVDFLLFRLRVPFTKIPIPFADPWPAFNVADSCICIATALFLIAAVFESAGLSRAHRNLGRAGSMYSREACGADGTECQSLPSGPGSAALC